MIKLTHPQAPQLAKIILVLYMLTSEKKLFWSNQTHFLSKRPLFQFDYGSPVVGRLNDSREAVLLGLLAGSLDKDEPSVACTETGQVAVLDLYNSDPPPQIVRAEEFIKSRLSVAREQLQRLEMP